MTDFVARAKALNTDIGRINKASDESRTRLKVRKEQFVTMLQEFGKQEGIDLVKHYEEGGLEGIEEMLRKLHSEASLQLEREVGVSQKIIEAYGQKDFAEIDKLLGRAEPKKVVKAPVKEKAVEVPVAEVAPEEVPEEVVAVPETESVFAQIARQNNAAESIQVAEEDYFKESPLKSVVGEQVSVLDAIAGIDNEVEPAEQFVQTTTPSLSNFGGGAMAAFAAEANAKLAKAPAAPKEAEKAPVKATASLFADTDDADDFAKPVVAKQPSKVNLFEDNGEEESAEFGDITVGDILGKNANIGTGF